MKKYFIEGEDILAGEYFKCSDVFEVLDKLRNKHKEFIRIAEEKGLEKEYEYEFDRLLGINEVIQCLKECEK